MDADAISNTSVSNRAAPVFGKNDTLTGLLRLGRRRAPRATAVSAQFRLEAVKIQEAGVELVTEQLLSMG